VKNVTKLVACVSLLGWRRAAIKGLLSIEPFTHFSRGKNACMIFSGTGVWGSLCSVGTSFGRALSTISGRKETGGEGFGDKIGEMEVRVSWIEV